MTTKAQSFRFGNYTTLQETKYRVFAVGNLGKIQWQLEVEYFSTYFFNTEMSGDPCEEILLFVLLMAEN